MRVEAVRTLTAEEAIVGLRAKIDRLGAVNMMAIEQFDELEMRHQFLTTQRRISSTRSPRPTRRSSGSTRRRRSASAKRSRRSTATSRDVQHAVRRRSCRAHAARRDRSARKRHRHRCVASGQAAPERAAPVGRREGADRDRAHVRDLQVQAEPVLSARRNRRAARRREHRPVRRDAAGACCDHTQFILITHNRRTMEIADRLYGVTMEEPGVSKLISVRLN